jgi:hypothetical protein
MGKTTAFSALNHPNLPFSAKLERYQPFGIPKVLAVFIPRLSQDFVREAESRVRECRAWADSLRNLMPRVYEGDFSLLGDPEA